MQKNSVETIKSR